MSPDEVAILLLASGLSRRFDAGNKLTARFGKRALAEYAALTAAKFPACARYAVVAENDSPVIALFEQAGLSNVLNPAPEAGQGASLSLGVNAIKASGAEAILVMLADMPFVSEQILGQLCDSLGTAEAAICCAGEKRSPPVLFRKALFDQLASLRGDEGARVLMKQLPQVALCPVDEAVLQDIDTAEVLQRLTPPY